MQIVDRLLDALASLFRGLAAFCLAVMLAINALNISWRGLTNHAFDWVFPWTMLLFVWMLFFGFYAYTRGKRDVVVDLVVARMPPAVARLLVILADLIGVAFMAIILSAAPALIDLQLGQMETIALPIYVRSVPLFVSAALVLLHFAVHAYSVLTGRIVPFPRAAEPAVEVGAVE